MPDLGTCALRALSGLFKLNRGTGFHWYSQVFTDVVNISKYRPPHLVDVLNIFNWTVFTDIPALRLRGGYLLIFRTSEDDFCSSENAACRADCILRNANLDGVLRLEGSEKRLKRALVWGIAR